MKFSFATMLFVRSKFEEKKKFDKRVLGYPTEYYCNTHLHIEIYSVYCISYYVELLHLLSMQELQNSIYYSGIFIRLMCALYVNNCELLRLYYIGAKDLSFFY